MCGRIPLPGIREVATAAGRTEVHATACLCFDFGHTHPTYWDLCCLFRALFCYFHHCGPQSVPGNDEGAG